MLFTHFLYSLQTKRKKVATMQMQWFLFYCRTLTGQDWHERLQQERLQMPRKFYHMKKVIATGRKQNWTATTLSATRGKGLMSWSWKARDCISRSAETLWTGIPSVQMAHVSQYCDTKLPSYAYSTYDNEMFVLHCLIHWLTFYFLLGIIYN
jgi:hypothetical protein